MKLTVVNTTRGLLVPESDEDHDEKKILRIGETYVVDIRLVRCPEFHRKYFAMIRCAWSLLPESIARGFGNANKFRKYLEVTAGYCEPLFNKRLGDFVDVPISIAYEAMDQTRFAKLYSDVRTVIDSIVSRYITPEEFEKSIMNF